MTALDTNILVRLVTEDDASQLPIVLTIMRESTLFVAKSVLLETAWVLGFTYGLSRDRVNSILRALVAYPNIHLEDAGAVLRALDYHREGMDFADALHLASSPPGAPFATFDRKLASRAAEIDGASPVRLLGGIR